MRTRAPAGNRHGAVLDRQPFDILDDDLPAPDTNRLDDDNGRDKSRRLIGMSAAGNENVRARGAPLEDEDVRIAAWTTTPWTLPAQATPSW